MTRFSLVIPPLNYRCLRTTAQSNFDGLGSVETVWKLHFCW